MPFDRIGDFEFASLVGDPTQVAFDIQPFVRPGNTQHGFVENGSHGTPFVLRSRTDVATWTLGQLLQLMYQTLPTTGPHKLIYGGNEWWNSVMVVRVLSRQFAAFRQIGGFTAGTGLAQVTAEWHLIPVEY